MDRRKRILDLAGQMGLIRPRDVEAAGDSPRISSETVPQWGPGAGRARALCPAGCSGQRVPFAGGSGQKGAENRLLFGYCAETPLLSEYFMGAHMQLGCKTSRLEELKNQSSLKLRPGKSGESWETRASFLALGHRFT